MLAYGLRNKREKRDKRVALSVRQEGDGVVGVAKESRPFRRVPTECVRAGDGVEGAVFKPATISPAFGPRTLR